MAARYETLDIDAMPELSRVAAEVAATGRPRALRRGGKEIAVLQPVDRANRRRRKPSEKDIEAFLSSAGGWRDNVDVDRFLQDVYESRDRPSRPPVDL
ncbi:MAG: hypothetical protein U0893_19125 [Chloroflexota bacterium]